MPDDNLIATLEKSLRQTRNAQQRLLVRLREVESEADRLKQEIEAMENSAEQTEAAIYSLLATVRSGNQRHNLNNLRIDDDYEIPSDLRRLRERPPLRGDSGVGGSRSMDGYGRSRQDYDDGESYGGSRNVPAISQRIEPISQRFSDRTIIQACTLLLRESGKPLHVNELYNFLVSGGYDFTGKNPTISIAVSLNRNKRFRKVAPGTFDLVMRDASQAAS